MTFGAGFGFPRARFPMGAAPTLNMDFAGTAALPPYVTFSRGTNATYVDSLGNIAYAPSNLLTYSEQFDNAAWSKARASVTANSIAAPNNTLTADTLVEDTTASNTHLAFSSSITASAGTIYTYTIYAKAAGRSWLNIQIGTGTEAYGSLVPFCFFNITDGSIGTFANCTGVATLVGNGWYRCVLTAIATTVASTTNMRLKLAESSTSDSYTGDGVSGLYIWGAQLNLDGLQPYNSTTVKNLLGYTQDFDNAAWTKSNSFIQTNLLTYSEQFDNAAWTKQNVAVVANSSVAPNQTTTADTVTRSINASAYIGNSSGAGVAGRLTLSTYAKASTTGGGLGIRIQGTYPNRGDALFNLNDGTLSGVLASGTAANASASIIDQGNGWYRCSVTVTLSDILNTTVFSPCETTAPVAGFESASTVASNCILWGAQLVQGATPGDYQATTTAALAVQYRAPDGSLTADKLVEDTANSTHYVRQTPTGTVNTSPMTLTVYAKAGERSNIMLALQEGSPFTRQTNATFNLLDGTVSAISELGGASASSSSITPIGNGWFRCRLTTTLGGAANSVLSWVYARTEALLSYTGDGTSGIYIWGAQLSDSASLDPYSYNFTTAPTAAAYYGPRFDYDPVTLACEGLLIEEQRTNSIRNNTMQGAVAGTPGTLPTNWAEIGAGLGTLVRTIATGIENGISYVDIKFTGTTSTVSVGYSSSAIGDIAASNAQTWTGSGYYKIVAGSTTNIANTFQIIEERTGAGAFIGNTTSAFTPTATLTRFTQTHTLAGGATVGQVRSGFLVSFSSGAAIDITLRIGLPQLELGAFATSVIPTTTTAVTRAADVAVIQGANFSNWYNQSEGTLYADSAPQMSNAGSYTIVEAGDGTANNRLGLFKLTTTGNASFAVLVGGAVQVSTNNGAWSATGKMAAAYKIDDFASAFNGGAVATDTNGLIPAVTQLTIGRRQDGASILNGHIARIAYYSTRQPNATLQAITTT